MSSGHYRLFGFVCPGKNIYTVRIGVGLQTVRVSTEMAAQVVGPAPKPYNVSETLASFDSVPLFMKSLPEETAEDSALAALQSLVYDGSPDGG
jgi:hypothetical protein